MTDDMKNTDKSLEELKNAYQKAEKRIETLDTQISRLSRMQSDTPLVQEELYNRIFTKLGAMGIKRLEALEKSMEIADLLMDQHNYDVNEVPL